MVSFEQIRHHFKDRSPAYPQDWPKPTIEEIQHIQKEFNIIYPQQFIDFQITECFTTPIGDFAFDGFGWANSQLEPYLNLRTIVDDAFSIGVPKIYSPFKGDNSDYYCFTENDKIVVWDHNSGSLEQNKEYQWDSFTDWIYKTMESKY